MNEVKVPTGRMCVTALTAPYPKVGAMIGVVVENEAGYHPTPWFFPTMEAAEKYAKEYNGKLGLTPLEAWRIVASSMRQGNALPPPLGG